MELGACCAILKCDWVHGTLFMALFRMSKPPRKHFVITLVCYHKPAACVLSTKYRQKRITYYKGVP